MNVAADDLEWRVAALAGGDGVNVVVESVGRDATYGQAIGVVGTHCEIMFFDAAQER